MRVTDTVGAAQGRERFLLVKSASVAYDDLHIMSVTNADASTQMLMISQCNSLDLQAHVQIILSHWTM